MNKYIFDSIEELKEITEDWLIEYNYKRPHSSLGGLPPKIFLHQKNINNIDKIKNKNIVEKITG